MEIENGDILPFCSEYMEAEKIRPPLFGMMDVRFVCEPGTSAGRSSRNSKQVAKKHSNNINISLTEAVVDSVVGRLNQFLNIAFYGNSYALACDRWFWVGPRRRKCRQINPRYDSPTW